MSLLNVYGKTLLSSVSKISTIKPLCQFQKQSTIPSKCLLSSDFSSKISLLTTSSRNYSTEAEACKDERLYRAVFVYLKGSENSVLNSYAKFCTMAAEYLDIKHDEVMQPKSMYDRLTLLKSAVNYGAHRVQYEVRTYKRVVPLKYLTGTTADVYLEYIQRNIPAGVAMHVHRFEAQRLPEHIREQISKNSEKLTDKDWKREGKQMQKMADTKDMKNKDFEEYITTQPYLIGTTM